MVLRGSSSLSGLGQREEGLRHLRAMAYTSHYKGYRDNASTDTDLATDRVASCHLQRDSSDSPVYRGGVSLRGFVC